MIGIQIVAIIFALFMMYFSYLHYRRREFTAMEFSFWMTLWVGLAFIVIFPRSASFILRTFSISRTFDLVIIVAIIVLFGVTFRNYVILKRVAKKVEEFVRAHALEDHEKKEP